MIIYEVDVPQRLVTGITLLYLLQYIKIYWQVLQKKNVAIDIHQFNRWKVQISKQASQFTETQTICPSV
jgi:hypothetical protein